MIVKFQKIYRPVIFLCLLAILQSCGEKVPLPAKNSTYDISYTGNMEIGEKIIFQTDAPAGSQLLWLFSDGNSSTLANPEQVFYKLSYNGAAIADDTVTLIVNNDVYHRNVKTFRLRPNVGKLAGMRAWKGGNFSLHGNCCPGFTNHSLNDTLFGISVADSFTLKSWSAVMPYLADSNYYSNERSSGRYNATWLRYTRDTLFFRQRSGTADGWTEITYFHKF
ncbi:MAG: PKD domain-containing protein [Taibaiella sp.]|nr:PKD domain-containing protein [Taibaiella sp.]